MSSIQSILIRPARKAPPLYVQSVEITSHGIRGDHYDKHDGNRQVTLIAKDGLATVAAAIGFEGDPHLACRRNIMIDSFPDEDLKGKRVQLGNQVILEITGYCSPCTRMDENFGDGAIQAFDKKGGWTAKVIQSGSVSVGDPFFLR
jgi:MOSC domain-containing protein YiiM